MHSRQERFLIPGTVAFLAGLLTLWACAGLQAGPLMWLSFIKLDQGVLLAILGFVAALGVANVGVGYVCHIVYTSLMLSADYIRLIDLRRLFEAFGFNTRGVSSHDLRRYREDLLAEFHLRLHSHAPKGLLDHCDRRNSGWYIAQASALALTLGWLFALLIMLDKTNGWSSLWWLLKINENLLSFFIVAALFLLLLPAALVYQGHRWNREYWEVCWKWIGWDMMKNPAKDWKKWMMDKLADHAAQQPAETGQDR